MVLASGSQEQGVSLDIDASQNTGRGFYLSLLEKTSVRLNTKQ